MPIPATLVAAVYHFAQNGQDTNHVRVWYASTTDNSSSPNAALAEFLTLSNNMMISAVGTTLPVDCRYTGVHATLRSGNGYAANATTTDTVGTVTGDSLPPYAAVLIKRRSGFPGRFTNGRNYWPCISESHTDGYVLNASGVTNWGIFRDVLDDDITGMIGTYTPINWDEGNQNAYTITGWELDTVLRTMRSRRVKRLLP